MNLRIVTFLSYEGDETEIKELVADFCESLIARGFGNNVEDNSSQLQSLVVVKENTEVLEMQPEVFFQIELENALMTVIPTEPISTVGIEREADLIIDDKPYVGESIFPEDSEVERVNEEDGA